MGVTLGDVNSFWEGQKHGIMTCEGPLALCSCLKAAGVCAAEIVALLERIAET